MVDANGATLMRPERHELSSATASDSHGHLPAQADAQTPPTPPAVPTPPGVPAIPGAVVGGGEIPAPGRIIINGKEISVDGSAGGADVFNSTNFPGGLPMDLPPNVYSLAKDGIIGFSAVLIAFPVFGFLKALVNRRASAQQALPSRDTTDRLQRIESAVEAMSVEVERISEGQRFVTKVLAERSSAPG